VSSPEEVMEVIDEGKANRHVAVTSKCYRFCSFVYLSLGLWHWGSSVISFDKNATVS